MAYTQKALPTAQNYITKVKPGADLKWQDATWDWDDEDRTWDELGQNTITYSNLTKPT